MVKVNPTRVIKNHGIGQFVNLPGTSGTNPNDSGRVSQYIGPPSSTKPVPKRIINNTPRTQQQKKLQAFRNAHGVAIPTPRTSVPPMFHGSPRNNILPKPLPRTVFPAKDSIPPAKGGKPISKAALPKTVSSKVLPAVVPGPKLPISTPKPSAFSKMKTPFVKSAASNSDKPSREKSSSKSSFKAPGLGGAATGVGLYFSGSNATNSKLDAARSYNSAKVNAFTSAGLPSYMAYTSQTTAPPSTATLVGSNVKPSGYYHQTPITSPSFFSQYAGISSF